MNTVTVRFLNGDQVSFQSESVASAAAFVRAVTSSKPTTFATSEVPTGEGVHNLQAKRSKKRQNHAWTDEELQRVKGMLHLATKEIAQDAALRSRHTRLSIGLIAAQLRSGRAYSGNSKIAKTLGLTQ